MRSINEIVVHCTATPEGRHITVSTIRKWHKQRGWSDIGYHYVIYLDGSIHEGRPVSKVGAHVRGRNTGTIGIAYVGGVALDGRTPKDTRTPAQKAAIIQLITNLKTKFPSIIQVSGHNQYAAKACPSFDASTVYDHLVGKPANKPTKPPAQIDPRYRYLQRLLTNAGFNPGLAEGIPNDATRKAIGEYQVFMGLPVTKTFDEATVSALRAVEVVEPPIATPKRDPAPRPPTPTAKREPKPSGLSALLVAILKLFGRTS